MGENEEWVISVNSKLNEMGDASTEMEQWEKRSIYRVPACVIDLNKKAYKPQLVSFGPYHYGEEHLKPMEEHKHRALLHFLERSGKSLECYVNSLTEVAEDLRHAYESLDVKWQRDTQGFIKLMILDGCFMLEVLHVATTTTFQGSNDDDHHRSVYASNDPIFSNHGKLYIMPYIKRDMLMLENQLPMLLLHKLTAVAKGHDMNQHDEEYLNKLIVKFCSLNTRASKLGKCCHVLDVYRKSLLWEDPHRKKKTRSKAHSSPVNDEGDEIVRSATELNEAGIRFKKSKTRSLKGISFHGGVLKLPPIVVDDATESMFLNLIAYERFHVGAGNEVTSYIFFMDNIIDNAKDVCLLHAQGIIQNAIGSDKAVAKLFNSLSKDITLDPDSPLDIVHKGVHKYCKKPWNEWRANLIHTYFRNPWAILSVLAAGLLFALTIIQTIYTVFPKS